MHEGAYRTIAIADSMDDNESITASLVAGQTYLLSVYGFDDSTNLYDLSIGPVGFIPPGEGQGDGVIRRRVVGV